MRHRNGVIPSEARILLLLFFLLPHLAPAQTPPDPVPELTFAEFRALIPSHAVENPAAAASVREIFFELLSAQGREAAASQSLDRLAGWTKAAQARLDAESAPLLDVEMLRFAEAQAGARVERFEAARLSASAQINTLLGREPHAPLRALGTENSPPDASDLPPEDKLLASRIARLEQLLSQAQDLLAKVYQNYLFGGVTLSALLWQEEQTYETELRYRQALAEAEQFRARLP